MKIKISNNAQWESHRYGWKFVLNLLRSYETSDGIILDPFIDSTFGFEQKKFISQNLIPYNENWVGFWHHPINIPPWLNSEGIAPSSILENVYFKKSLKNCKGIFTFSDYLSSYLQNNLNDVPVISLFHPTGFEVPKFNYRKFIRSKKVIHVGSWLRRMTSFYKFKSDDYRKFLLLGNAGLINLKAELSYYNFNIEPFNDVQYITFVDDEIYDEFLSESIVFLDLYDSSVNNTIIECIVRYTPILVNKTPSTLEYLGENYPLYYTDLSQVATILQNFELIKAASIYLKENPIQNKLKAPYFLDSLKLNLEKLI